MTEMVRDLEGRVAATLGRLDRATSYDQAMAVLSLADTATLRAIEEQSGARHPASITTLRGQLAAAHLARKLTTQSSSTGRVSPGVVTGWAYAALREWMTGRTEFDPGIGGEFDVTLVADDTDGLGQLYRVTTPDGGDPREFLIRVDAKLVAVQP